MKSNILFSVVLAGSLLSVSSCQKQLDRGPIVGATPSSVYSNIQSIAGIQSKLYAGLTLSGINAGSCDLGNFDPGTSVFYRQFWDCEELPTDEVKIAWNDGNLPDLNTNTWNADNDKLHIMYDRVFYEVSLCNEFLREVSAAKTSSFSAADQATLKSYIAEARFLRAFSYWIAIDFFGNVPFTTEASSVGTTPPPQVSRATVFNYCTSELRAIQNDLLAPGTSWGRADQGAAWTLLAKLYLNAAVYTGTAKYDSASMFCQKVINSTYSLAPSYANIFKIDNNVTSKQEIIFPLTCDGNTSQSYGNSTFLICAELGNKLVATDYGVSGAWAGYRATKNLVGLFTSTSDQRYLLDSVGQTLEMPVLLNYPNGYSVVKFKNTSSTGASGSNPAFADLDIPLFRLADVYLMYAEASLRNGDAATALTYVNKVRERAYGGATGDLTAVTLSDILDERGRELYCEGTRRTDLIRFGVYAGGGYLWPWKGGSAAGAPVDAHYSIFPITSVDLNVNPNLKQNPGY